MCLSTVYHAVGGEQRLLCRNVASVQSRDGRLVLTDLMGAQTVVDAAIERIDLMENTILLRSPEQEDIG